MAALVSWVEDRFPWLLLIAGAVLLLANLGNVYLWQDEAETALLSQRLGTYGLPLAFDGRNLIRQAPKDVQYTADYVWVYHPWLPFFLTAGLQKSKFPCIACDSMNSLRRAGGSIFSEIFEERMKNPPGLRFPVILNSIRFLCLNSL